MTTYIIQTMLMEKSVGPAPIWFWAVILGLAAVGFAKIVWEMLGGNR